MAYRSGDARLVTRAEYEESYGPDDGEGYWMPSDSRHGKVKRFPYVDLPHSCDAWVIGTRSEVALMIQELQALLQRMEETNEHA